jgi:hypothetical protein
MSGLPRAATIGVALVLMAGAAFIAFGAVALRDRQREGEKASGGETARAWADRELPAIDATAVNRTETATFSLG